MSRFLQSWRQDRLLQGVVRNSGYLFSSNTAAILLSLVQGILAARLLGSEGYGILAATVIPLVSNVNRLLSFRMSELVVKYLGQYLAQEKRDQAAALVKAAALAEAVTSLVAYLALLLAAPLAALYLAKDPHTSYLFYLYGLVLLANWGYETASGVLQAFKLFDRLALINLLHSVITASLILAAYLGHGGMLEVLLAHLLGKSIAGMAVYWVAWRRLNQELGGGWWKASLSNLPDWRGLARFGLSTNLQGTTNLIVRDSETLFISALRSPVEAGYFRIALAVINLVMLPIEPFIVTTYAEISRTIARRDWSLTKQLLKRVSVLSGAWTLISGMGLAVFGFWLIPLLYGAEFQPAYPAVLLLLLGYGFANILNWNRPLLLALGMPAFPLTVNALAGVVKTVFTLSLVPLYGYLAEAGVLSIYFVTTVSVIVWRGLSEIRLRSESSQPA